MSIHLRKTESTPKENTRFEQTDFVARWIADELSPVESAEFEGWLAANPDKKMVFDEMLELWRGSGSATLQKGLSAEARWRRIQQAAGLSESEHLPKVARGPR